MTPLPKRRWSTQRQGKKRATHKARSIEQGKCSNCGESKQNHTACPKCGYYKGNLVLVIKTKNKSNKNEESSLGDTK